MRITQQTSQVWITDEEGKALLIRKEIKGDSKPKKINNLDNFDSLKSAI